MSEFNLKHEHALGMDYIIAGFTTTLAKTEFARLKEEAESNRKSIMLNVLENDSEVPCKVLHRTTIQISEDNARDNPTKLIEKLIYLTDPVVATGDEEEGRTDEQGKLLIESASFQLDYLIEAYKKLDLQVLTIVPDGTSPDDCDELTFGCGMKLIEDSVAGNIVIETILIMPNIVPFFWREGRVIYDVENKNDVTEEYFKGMIEMLHPIIPKGLTEKLEYSYAGLGYSCDDRTDMFMAGLEIDEMRVPALDEDTELPLAYGMREDDLFCVVMPYELIEGYDGALEDALIAETEEIDEISYPDDEEDDEDDEDGEEDDEIEDDEDEGSEDEDSDEVEDEDDNSDEEEQVDKKPAAH